MSTNRVLREIGRSNPSLLAIHLGAKGKVIAEGRCRMCQRLSSVRPLTRHHLVPISWFRRYGRRFWHARNADANVVPLCRACHDYVEDEEHGRIELRRVMTQTEVAFIVQVVGKTWLDLRYPLGAVSGEGMRSRGMIVQSSR